VDCSAYVEYKEAKCKTEEDILRSLNIGQRVLRMDLDLIREQCNEKCVLLEATDLTVYGFSSYFGKIISDRSFLLFAKYM
jgi:hypothetical protein